ncbi:uncharacterized protein N7469_002087 [Penicillium citrinum]|uniref:Uncharacterized protein n=1 Tax=Penicillium citrinum TaxID=5077 RepID=A0A9W9P9M0_PENCI|nr:uncharacterized protein N7469_002087 [Penicillium citrinum]KAJ5240496.1 hypothetical protein N7469_002087 [Penicillium citrinum]
MADLEDSSLQSVADWLTPTNPFQFKYPFSSNDFQLHSHSFSILWDETGDNAPEKDPGEYTYPQSPLTGLDNLYSVDTLCDEPGVLVHLVHKPSSHQVRSVASRTQRPVTEVTGDIHITKWKSGIGKIWIEGFGT